MEKVERILVTIHPTLLREFDRRVKIERRPRSEVIREALRRYLAQEADEPPERQSA